MDSLSSKERVALSMTVELANAYTLLAELSQKYLGGGSRALGTLALEEKSSFLTCESRTRRFLNRKSTSAESLEERRASWVVQCL